MVAQPEARADVNATDKQSVTALLAAAAAGQTLVLQLLASNGASVQGTDDKGRSALHLAVLGDHSFTAEVRLA